MQSMVLRAKEVAKAAGVSTDTLRHYERLGVLPSPRRSINGYREYSQEVIERVLLVRQALSIGFTLPELARILKTREMGGAPCSQVRELAVAKLKQLELRIEEMVSLREVLIRTLEDWDVRLAAAPAGERARLLDALSIPGRPAHPYETWRLRKQKVRKEKEG
jgi:MerR family transcriptional regulator, Zn(II)-responsive regulator of zntA